uniref:Acid phosphatase-like protein 2 n=1 Tax=Syphacia muris TaxID=451379 RepID=A0A0N5AFD8_9BILA
LKQHYCFEGNHTVKYFGGKSYSRNGLQQDCQFLEREIVGQEGNVPETVAMLRSVIITFRHGDRSTLYGDFSGQITDCTPFRDSDRCAFSDYTDLVNSNSFDTFIVSDANLAKFQLVPHPASCTKGNLTAEGALQLLKLGNFLREQYTNVGFFTEKVNGGLSGFEWNLKVYSSLYARTFQSAIAFISSFIFPMRNFFSKAYVNASDNEQFCFSELCKCRALPLMEKVYSQTRTSFFENAFGNKTMLNLKRVLNVLQIKNLKDPLHFLDVVRGRYLCRRLPLPCYNGTCVKYADVKEMNTLVSARDYMMFNDFSQGPSLFRRLMVAQSTGILYSIQNHIEALLRASSKSKYVHIFSGHDITLRPLLFVLGLDHTEPPHYASRLVVEIYQRNWYKSHNLNLYFRLLYNGEDRTNELSFCTNRLFNNILCPVDYLMYFIKSQLLQVANVTTLDAICDANLGIL